MNEAGPSGKKLMKIASDFLTPTNDAHHETGLGFTICNGTNGIVAVMSDGTALPLYYDATFYDVFDAMAGEAIPLGSLFAASPSGLRYPTRAKAFSALSALGTIGN